MKYSLLRTVLAAALAQYAQAALACHVYPLDRHQRGLDVSPRMVNVSSGPNQFAGRTTLSSGSATATVSTFSVNSDSLISLHVQAALPAAYTTQGLVSIAAGAASGTASTTAVYSGQIMPLAYFSETAQSSGIGKFFRTTSIVDGVSFALATADGQNVSSGPAIVGWKIPQAEPAGIKVNTIGVGHFIIGWADQQARPVDTTVIWEIKRTS